MIIAVTPWTSRFRHAGGSSPRQQRAGAHLGFRYSEDAPGGPPGYLDGDAVNQVRFSRTWLRLGYNLREVDDFLGRIEYQLRGGLRPVPPLSADDVIATGFTSTKYRTGYDQDEVDDFLDRIVTELRRER